MENLAVLSGIVVAVIGGVFTWAGQKIMAKAQTNTARGPEWKAFTEELKGWTKDQLAERDAKIDRLQTEVDQLREKLEVWKSRYYIAVHYIRSIHVKFPDSLAYLPIPEELEQDF